MSKLGRAVRGSIAGAALLALFHTPSCVGTRGDTCYSNADCESGAFCADSGFCDYECKADVDCPCGSTCIEKCGLCVRDDLRGPATCFPVKRGLSTDEVLGTCAVEPSDVETGAAGSPDDARLCDPRVEAPQCLASPPVGGSGGGGAGGEGGESPRGGEGGTAGMNAMGGADGDGGTSSVSGMSGGSGAGAAAGGAPSSEEMPGSGGQAGVR